MKVLIACEESQAVTIEMRRLGHEAYSCDIQECSGGHPEWHIMQDVLPLLNGFCTFRTMDGAVGWGVRKGGITMDVREKRRFRNCRAGEEKQHETL